MVRRWVRFEIPVMVCVELDPATEDQDIVNVIVGTEEQDIHLARDTDKQVLIYDQDMQRLPDTEPTAAAAITKADSRGDWPEQTHWEFGTDALRDPWLYGPATDETADTLGEDGEDGESASDLHPAVDR